MRCLPKNTRYLEYPVHKKMYETTAFISSIFYYYIKNIVLKW